MMINCVIFTSGDGKKPATKKFGFGRKISYAEAATPSWSCCVCKSLCSVFQLRIVPGIVLYCTWNCIVLYPGTQNSQNFVNRTKQFWSWPMNKAGLVLRIFSPQRLLFTNTSKLSEIFSSRTREIQIIPEILKQKNQKISKHSRKTSFRYFHNLGTFKNTTEKIKNFHGNRTEPFNLHDFVNWVINELNNACSDQCSVWSLVLMSRMKSRRWICHIHLDVVVKKLDLVVKKDCGCESRLNEYAHSQKYMPLACMPKLHAKLHA